MRVHLWGDHSAHQFTALLLDIGDGKIKPDTDDGLMPIHKNVAAVVSSDNDLINSVFPNV